MSAKKVSFGITPAPKAPTPATPEQWIENRAAEPVKLKRLTLDIPADLHTRIKASCAKRGVAMVDEIRSLLEAHFPAE